MAELEAELADARAAADAERAQHERVRRELDQSQAELAAAVAAREATEAAVAAREATAASRHEAETSALAERLETAQKESAAQLEAGAAREREAAVRTRQAQKLLAQEIKNLRGRLALLEAEAVRAVEGARRAVEIVLSSQQAGAESEAPGEQGAVEIEKLFGTESESAPLGTAAQELRSALLRVLEERAAARKAAAERAAAAAAAAREDILDAVNGQSDTESTPASIDDAPINGNPCNGAAHLPAGEEDSQLDALSDLEEDEVPSSPDQSASPPATFDPQNLANGTASLI